MLTIGDLQGLWRRSLIVWPDGRRDDASAVSWLQGPNLYADLRRQMPRPDFSGVSGLYSLTRSQVSWLATQEGFAGVLSLDGEFFVWQRALDIQPPAAVADAGRLWLEAGRMIEEGRYVPYIEHWHRDDAAVLTPCGALILKECSTGATGFLVRTGPHFMYARARCTPLLPGGSLLDYVNSASLFDAQNLVDCEISLGRIGPSGWIIEDLSLPYREGAALRPVITADHTQLTISDVTGDCALTLRHWEIVGCEGELALNVVAEAALCRTTAS